MDEKEFKEIVDLGKYQVFLFKCPTKFPSNFAYHTWIVTNQLGKINRWDVFRRRSLCKTSWDYLHKNYLKPYEGLRIFGVGSFRSKSSLIGLLEGDAKSLAASMVKFVKVRVPRYKFRSKYGLLGPNSNTFVQWILDKFPESNLKLPFNSIGKKYLLKKN